MTDIADRVHIGSRRLAVASQWQLIWWAFRRHRLAMVGARRHDRLYIVAAVPGFFAVNDPSQQNAAPPIIRRRRSISSTPTRTAAGRSAPTSIPAG